MSLVSYVYVKIGSKELEVKITLEQNINKGNSDGINVDSTKSCFLYYYTVLVLLYFNNYLSMTSILSTNLLININLNDFQSIQYT